MLIEDAMSTGESAICVGVADILVIGSLFCRLIGGL